MDAFTVSPQIKAQEMRRVEVHYGLLFTTYYKASSEGPGGDDRKQGGFIRMMGSSLKNCDLPSG